MTISVLLLQILVILVACRLVQALVARLGQPSVIGQIMAGLLLGPSFLGWLRPTWYAHLFPDSSLPTLAGLSQIGLILFMFLVGMRLDLSEVYGLRRVAGLAGLLSILSPFAAGLVLARSLRPYAPSGSGLAVFSLFIGVSMSITAFPVLARILVEYGLEQTQLGHIAISCAAMDDLAAWTLLAWISALARHGEGETVLLSTAATVLCYVLIMLGVVRPALRWLAGRYREVYELPVILPFLVLSSWVTELAGLHALFGAFLAGVVYPRDKRALDRLSNTFEPISVNLLLPLFFSYTGIRTAVQLLGPGGLWRWTLVIIALAICGKMGGAFLGARFMGLDSRDSFALGALLNTRGLVELVVLNVGLDLNILSPGLFSAMVLMALSTTVMTSPLIRRILR